MYTYEELREFVVNCQRCPLASTRHRAVMGKGDPKAPVMFVAEAPGNHEDMDGVPFTGRSGELLDQLLSGAGMSREEIYLTNVVKCHPPGNRDPKPEEQEQCMPYLTAVYHPSAVLRDMGKWEETLRDFRAIREKRDELAIGDKSE